jgi:hypothetical protein
MKEIFRAAATFGEALFHKRPEVSQKDLDAAAAVTVPQEMVGEKMTNILIARRSQKPKTKTEVQVV